MNALMIDALGTMIRWLLAVKRGADAAVDRLLPILNDLVKQANRATAARRARQ